MELGPYLARLALVLPALCLAIAGLLWLARQRLGLPLAAAGLDAAGGVRIAGWAALGAGHRLAVVEFAGRRLLLGVGRGQLVLLADSVPAADAPALAGGTVPAAAAPAAPAAGSGPSASASASGASGGASGFAAMLARRLARHAG